LPGAPAPVAPEAPAVEHPVVGVGDEASDGDKPTTLAEDPAKAFADDSPTQTRAA
jgi:hypothetical protein